MSQPVSDYLDHNRRAVARNIFKKIKSEKGATVKYILKFTEEDMEKVLDEIFELAQVLEDYNPPTIGVPYA